jgi:hypothetical protein
VMILTPKPPSSNTSSIVLFPICIWIIAIWLYVITVVVLAFGTEELTCFFVVALFKFWVFSTFSFYQRYIFYSGAILSNFPKFNLFLAFVY